MPIFSPESLCKGKLTVQTTDNLKLAFGVHRGPSPAPAKVLRQIETPEQALAVSILAGGHKLAYVAACIGKSVPYVSQLQNGRRPIPDRLVMPLCAATGSLLLRQFLDLQDALEGVCEVERLAGLLRAAA